MCGVGTRKISWALIFLLFLFCALPVSSQDVPLMVEVPLTLLLDLEKNYLIQDSNFLQLDSLSTMREQRYTILTEIFQKENKLLTQEKQDLTEEKLALQKENSVLKKDKQSVKNWQQQKSILEGSLSQAEASTERALIQSDELSKSILKMETTIDVLTTVTITVSILAAGSIALNIYYLTR